MISFYRTKYFNLLLIFVFINLQLIVNAQSISFNRLSTNNGLSNNYVSNLIQDRLGFLWFATDDGLNRFDGYDFKVFRNNPSDKSSISDNSTFAITEDDSGRIWIGTKIGYLNCYDPILDKFTYWKIESEITKDNSITNIHIDKKFNVWIGTYRSGLYKLDTKTGKTLNWTHKKDDPKSLSNNYISSIVEDDFGNFVERGILPNNPEISPKLYYLCEQYGYYRGNVEVKYKPRKIVHQGFDYSFDPNLDIWDIRKIESALSNGFVRTLLSDLKTNPAKIDAGYLSAMTTVLYEFFTSDAFGT